MTQKVPSRPSSSRTSRTVITLHLYDPREDLTYNRIHPSSPTLCGSTVGKTSGVITLKEYMNPYHSVTKDCREYRVKLTAPGRLAVQRGFVDRIIWSKFDGFWESELTEHDFKLCKFCTEHPDFALLVLSEV